MEGGLRSFNQLWVWMLQCVGGFLISFIFWTLVFPITLLLLLPIRQIVQSSLDLIHGKGRFILASGIDAVFAHDQTPGSSSAPLMLLVHRGQAPDIDVVRSRFLKHIFNSKKTEHLGATSANYAQRLRSRFIPNKWGWPVWENMYNALFDIRNHVRVMEPPRNAQVTTEEDLMLRMGQIMQENEVSVSVNPQPQWEFLIFPNYVPKNGASTLSHFASLVRLHHAYGDGSSFLLLVDRVLGDRPISWSLDPMRPPPLVSSLSLGVIKLKSYIFGVLPFLRTLGSAILDNSPFLVDAKVGYSTSKVVGWTEPLPLTFFKELANASRTAFSSIVLTAFTGALRKLHQRKFREKPGEFVSVGVVTAMIPYTTSELQNSFSIYSIPCAMGEPDVALRLEKTHSSVKSVSSSSEPLFNFFIMRLTGILPRLVMDVLLASAGTPVLYSNIPGPTQPISLFGSDVVELGGWLPLIKSYGLGLTSISTCGKVRLCVSADCALILSSRELARFMNELETELEVLGKIHRVSIGLGRNSNKGNRKVDVGDKRTTA